MITPEDLAIVHQLACFGIAFLRQRGTEPSDETATAFKAYTEHLDALIVEEGRNGVRLPAELSQADDVEIFDPFGFVALAISEAERIGEAEADAEAADHKLHSRPPSN